MSVKETKVVNVQARIMDKGRFWGLVCSKDNQTYYVRRENLIPCNCINVQITRDLRVLGSLWEKDITAIQGMPEALGIGGIIKPSLQQNNTITLYHGTAQELKGAVRYDCSRDFCDFGRGFYTGDLKEQAEEWAVGKTACGIVYKLSANLQDLKVFTFNSMSDWALCIAVFRKVGDYQTLLKQPKIAAIYQQATQSDVIIGPIADDRMLIAYDQFIQSILTIEGLAQCLNYVNLGNQYVFKTAKACKCLQIIEKYKIDTKAAMYYQKLKLKRQQDMNTAMLEIREATKMGSTLYGILKSYGGT